MKKGSKKHITVRNWVAVAAFQRSGCGKHHTRDMDVSKGRSRKVKHKQNAADLIIK
jgi:hypothetical protein